MGKQYPNISVFALSEWLRSNDMYDTLNMMNQMCKGIGTYRKFNGVATSRMNELRVELISTYCTANLKGNEIG